MTKYNDGRRFEYAVRNALQDAGYWVMRSAGSKSKVDLLALKQDELLLVQCKRHGVLPPSERAELLRLAGLNQHAKAIKAFKLDGVASPFFHELVGVGAKDYRPFILEKEK